jgi:regulator of cell morphogenesis and NO signaling
MPTITETVREIALSQPSSMRVFEQFGIDYCCGGQKPLAVACNEQDLEIGAVLAALANAASEPAPQRTDWSKASLEELIHHILLQHHEYVKKELPRLDALAQKVVAKHYTNHVELLNIHLALQKLDQELTQHLAKEETALFPYIVNLEHARNGGGATPESCFGTVANPIRMMTQEHDGAGELLAELRQLSGNFTPPPDACSTYHAFYAGLKEFEQDLHQHIHLENNILFPRAIALEASSAR